jgi:ribonuclease P protein component
MERLRQRADFVAASSAPRIPTAAFILQGRPRGDDGPARFGLTVSRKVGSATERNRARRRLKEVIRSTGAASAVAGHDYVLVARREALTQPFERLIADFGGALRRLAAGRGQPARHRAGRDSKPRQNATPASREAAGEPGSKGE